MSFHSADKTERKMCQRKGETIMKRKISILAIVISVIMVAVQPALAANGDRPENGCQPGANNDIVQEWQLLSQSEFALHLEGLGRSPESSVQVAARVYAFCDHNGDGSAGMMEQNLPNDANGSSYWMLIEDNHPFGGQ
jgi:hypothetical protein